MTSGWHPVASTADVPRRHVCHGELLGQEFAIWRADDGYLNVWDNRCLHRGVRLSIGINDGHELRCQYHAWRYANRTGGCTYIPAHPGDAPASSLCARVFPSAERYGMVWANLDHGGGEPPTIDVLDRGEPFALHHLPVDAPAATVAAALASDELAPSDRAAWSDAAARIHGPLTIERPAVDIDPDNTIVYFVQPVDDDHCVVRGVLARTPAPAERLAVLRRHEQRLTELRARIEATGAATRPWAQMPSTIAPVDAAGAAGATARVPEIPVVVRRKWSTADDVVAIELVPLEGVLPTVQPGAHIDLHLPGGLVRQYSLTNGPGEQHLYRIGVKLEPVSTGGSAYVHDELREGDVLSISRPHPNFTLRRDAVRTVLLAGGIGVTPLLAMAQALAVSGPTYELHVFARGAAHVPFADVLDRLGAAVSRHVGLGPDETVAEMRRILGPFRPASQVYVCGPAPMLEAARREAAELGWPDDTVHFEYFRNTRVLDESSAFEVELARSGLTVTVPAGRSILEVVREHGVAATSSCEQGACGSCLVAVLDGEPDHQDVYLRESEHAAGTRMAICVSRARSARLVLDL